MTAHRSGGSDSADDREEICEFSDLPRGSCSHCIGIPDERSTINRDGERFFPAAFRGVCDECGYPIEEGESIAHYLDGYIHRGCR